MTDFKSDIQTLQDTPMADGKHILPPAYGGYVSNARAVYKNTTGASLTGNTGKQIGFITLPRGRVRITGFRVTHPSLSLSYILGHGAYAQGADNAGNPQELAAANNSAFTPGAIGMGTAETDNSPEFIYVDQEFYTPDGLPITMTLAGTGSIPNNAEIKLIINYVLLG